MIFCRASGHESGARQSKTITMSQLNTYVNCPDLQLRINEIITRDPQIIREDTVLNNFLLSDMNLAGARQGKLQSSVSPGSGKSRRVEVVYSPRLQESDVNVNSGRDDCSTDNKVGDTSYVYDVGDNYIQEEASLNLMELRYTCEENTVRLARTIMMLMDVVMRKRETMLFQSLLLQYGNFAAEEPDVTDKIKEVSTTDADGRFSVDAMEDIGVATRYAMYAGLPVVIGGRTMSKYMRALAAGCCSKDGINIGELTQSYGMFFLESYRADAEWGSDYFMSMDAGAVQLLEWLEFEGVNDLGFIDMGNTVAMVLSDPRSGARFDVKIVTDCNLNINIFVRSYFKLVTLPQDLFYSTDRLTGVNFLNRYEIVNP